MASDETIKKMIHTIMDKRRKLGLPDWGIAPVEDVIERINRHGEMTSVETTENSRLAVEDGALLDREGTADPRQNTYKASTE